MWLGMFGNRAWHSSTCIIYSYKREHLAYFVVFHAALWDLVIVELVPLLGAAGQPLHDVAVVVATIGLPAVHHDARQLVLVASAVDGCSDRGRGRWSGRRGHVRRQFREWFSRLLAERRCSLCRLRTYWYNTEYEILFTCRTVVNAYCTVLPRVGVLLPITTR